MPTETIRIPDLGDVDEVEVVEVLVSVGDRVEVEDPLITLESDKASMDVPSPKAGKVTEIAVSEGDEVSEGDAILTLEVGEAEGESPDDEDDAAREDPAGDSGDEPDDEAEEEVDRAAATEDEAEDDDDRAPAEEESAEEEAAEPSIRRETVRVPDIGDMDEVEVVEVLVAVGDRVEVEDPLIMLESDKASMDVPSPTAGEVVEVAVAVGDKVGEGDAIVTLEVEEVAEAESAAEVSGKEAEGEEPEGEEPEEKEAAPEEADGEPGEPRGRRTTPPSPRAGKPTLPPIDEEAFERAYASPAVRRYARELGVDLGRVEGTGRKGRIVKEDVQAFVKRVMEGATAGPAAGRLPGIEIPEMPQIDFSKFGPVERQELSRIQKISGPRLHRSGLHVPHVTQHDEADITDLEVFRQENKAAAEEKGFKLTPLAFVMKAVVSALEEFPSVNASLDTEAGELILKKYYHLGIAVDTPGGLVVPVVREVDCKGIMELAEELGEVSQAARDGKLKPDQLQGASFTITSLGGIGGTAFTPVVNAPEVAILGVSRAYRKPVWQEDEDGGGDFVPRLMLPLSLSYDHRAIDGATAVRFTTFLARELADIRKILL